MMIALLAYVGQRLCKKECNCQVIMFNWLIIIFGFRAIYMVEKHFLSKKYLFSKSIFIQKSLFFKKKIQKIWKITVFSQRIVIFSRLYFRSILLAAVGLHHDGRYPHGVACRANVLWTALHHRPKLRESSSRSARLPLRSTVEYYTRVVESGVKLHRYDDI